ncbi:MAG: tetratricopeptide repeat protein [Clostridiales bacterium]|nr:tetratricopeptide repeat protein [Clostridiales bacterium]
MKYIRRIGISAAFLGIFLFSGCSFEQQNVYRQANEDLEAGYYQTALEGYESCIASGKKVAWSYRGAGISSLRLGNYDTAIDYFTDAYNTKKAGKELKKDVLAYRATAELKSGLYEQAMADCQTLGSDYGLDADGYFLTGQVALAMDSYEEAEQNFDEAYAADSTYDMAIQIYQAYMEVDLEADGTRYLEAVLTTEAKDTQDYCDRGRVYYYMGDYDSAKTELLSASKEGSSQALLLLGMVYQEEGDITNARAMYQQYISAESSSGAGYNGLALCDISEGDYDSALSNISQGLSVATSEEKQSLLFNEIVVYEKKLDFATALTKAQEYTALYPDDEEAVRELAFLETRVS